MTLQTTMPSKAEIKKIADAVDGCEETFSKALKYTLNEMGFDESVAQLPEFKRELDEHVFCCDHCDKWVQTGMRVINELAEDEMCEECDENY